jgi:hypothetical protein
MQLLCFTHNIKATGHGNFDAFYVLFQPDTVVLVDVQASSLGPVCWGCKCLSTTSKYRFNRWKQVARAEAGGAVSGDSSVLKVLSGGFIP